MLKFLLVARISNLCTFLVEFNLDFKHVVLSRLDELLCLPYMIENLKISSFQRNLNCNKIPLVAPNMSSTVHEDLVWQIWQDLCSNFDPLK
jgi:hypothetical protein